MRAYKVFDNDWTCKGFKFEIGKEYTYDGEVKICQSGFHACEKLQDCFKYYPCVPWMKIAEVEMLGEIKEHTEDSKIVTNKIKIIKEIPFGDIEKIIRNDISGRNNIWGGNNIKGGHDIWGGSYIGGGNDIRGGNAISGGNNIRGGNNIKGGNNCIGSYDCSGIANDIFSAHKKETFTVFGKEVTEDRFKEIKNKILELWDNWYPKFNNLHILYLKAGSKWEETPIPNAKAISKEEAWADMPKKALEYIRSLPEFDAKTFAEIAGLK